MNKNFLYGACLVMSNALFAQSPEEGVKYLENEQFSKAKGVFSQLLQKKQSGDNYYYMGNYYNKIEEYDSAKVYFDKGIALDSKNGLNYAGLGIVQWLKGDTAKARTNFENATSIRKRDAEVYYEIAKTMAYSDLKNPNKGMWYIDQAIIYNKNNPDYLLTKGDLYILLKDGTKAIKCYNDALVMNPKSVPAYIRKGKIYLMTVPKNTDAALVEYNKGIALDPNYAPGYRERSELYFTAKKTALGLEDYKKYLSITDDNFDNNLRFARFLFKNKEYDNAIEVANKLKEKAPNNVALTKIFAYSYAEKKDSAKAYEYLDKLFKSAPAEALKAYDYDAYGDALIKFKKDTTAGIENKTKAIEMDKRFNKSYLAIANMYFDKKKYDKAGPYFDKANEAGLLDFYGKLNWGKSYYMATNYTKANEVFTALTEKEPNIPNWFIWKVKCEVFLDQDYKTDNIKNAVLKFVESTDKVKDKTQYNRNLGEAYTYLGSYYCINQKNKVEAENSWKKALEFDPKNANAANALANSSGCK